MPGQEHHPLKKAVTQRQIAARCGLTQYAVSLALRDAPNISTETIAHVKAVAAEMGYDPSYNQAARRLSLLKTGKQVLNHTVALFLPPTFYEELFSQSLLRGMLDVFAPRRFGLLTQYNVLNEEALRETGLSPVFSSGHVDAAILLTPPDIGLQIIRHMRGIPGFAQRPIVNLLSACEGCSSVTADYRQGAYETACHLLAQGHRHLGHFYAAWGFIDNQLARLDGVRQALGEYGLAPEHYLHEIHLGDARWIVPSHLDANAEAQLQLLYFSAGSWRWGTFTDLLAAIPRITALMCVNDTNALHIWHLLNARGQRVPEQMSLVGYDDTDAKLDEYGQNLLSSVSLPLVEMGEAAANHVLQRIADPDRESSAIILPATFIPRRSTCAPPSSTAG
jgi:DNA-binding LacI/PurR family transcriptional regulator